MYRRAQAIEHLERGGEDSSLTRSLSARLDTALNVTVKSARKSWTQTLTKE